MGGLVTEHGARTIQETITTVKGLSSSSGGTGGGNHRTQDVTPPSPIRTGKAYGDIPGGKPDRPGVGEIIFDRLDLTIGNFSQPESSTPKRVYNLTPVTIPNGSRLIAWRDGHAVQVSGGLLGQTKRPAAAWYVG